MMTHRHHDGPGSRHFHHPSELDGPGSEHPFRGHRGASPRGGGPRGGGPRGRGRGRAPRGDVRAAVLLLLSEQPMHGYQLMQAIAERSGGRWTPSPGAIYPAINLLEDEELVTVVADSGRKIVTLTDAGRAHVAEHRDSWPDPFTTQARPGPDLRDLLMQLHGAARQVGRTGSESQVRAGAEILTRARRELYLLLADGPEAADD